MQEKEKIEKNVSSGLLGFATADALGVPIEFTTRESHIKKPLTEMVGYGSHKVPEGTWSDDTSMTIATMDSIIKSKNVDFDDIMKKYCDWYINANYTATDKVFDIGIGTRNALASYYNKKTSAIESGGKEERNNGNGSLMRMLPIVLFLHYANKSEDDKTNIINNYSSLTHGHEISKLGCKIYYDFMEDLLNGKSIKESYAKKKKKDYSDSYSKETISKYSRILEGNLENIPETQIKSSGYIVNTLEAAIWSSLKSDNYEEAVVKAINLGDDTDTVGAITGSIAGIAYGKENIPKRWLSKLRKKELLDKLSLDYSNVLEEVNKKHSDRFYDEEGFVNDDELFKMLTSESDDSQEMQFEKSI